MEPDNNLGRNLPRNLWMADAVLRAGDWSCGRLIAVTNTSGSLDKY